MDIFATLKKQHCHLEDLFHDLTVARGDDRKARIFEELSDTLIAHVGLEERLLRIAVARAPRASGLLEAWEARLRVERLITMLSAMDVSSPTFDAEVARVQDLVEERVEHEELHLFPKIAPYITPATSPARPVALSAEALAHAA